MDACGSAARTKTSIFHHQLRSDRDDKCDPENFKAGVRHQICDVLERMARDNDPSTRVWKGSVVLLAEQGVKILGAPLVHQDYVRRFLNKVSEKHQILFQRIPWLSDVQSTWLRLVHGALSSANHTHRCIDPGKKARPGHVCLFVSERQPRRS